MTYHVWPARAVTAVIVIVLVMLAPPRGAGQNAPALQTGTITGRVILPDGTPLARARIAAITPELASNAKALIVSFTQTDREGQYRLEGLPPGRYYIVAGSLDTPVYLPNTRSKANATIVTATAAAVLEGQDFHLSGPLTMTISGRFVREGHQAGTEATLAKRVNRVAQTGGGGNRPTLPPGIMTTRIAADGAFEFHNVLPGAYEVRVGPDLDETRAVFLVEVVDQDVTGLEWFLPAVYVTTIPVNFTVTLDRDGLLSAVPLIFSAVSFVPKDLPRGKTELIYGPSMVRHLSVGEHRVTVGSDLPAGYVVKSITAGSANLLKDTLHVTAAGAPTIEIVLGVTSPMPWVKVTGRVTGMGTAPVKATMISISSAPLSVPLTASVSPDGSFQFPMALPGTYTAQLTPSADGFQRTFVVPRSGAENIEVPMIITTLRVKGRVTDLLAAANAGPAEAFTVMLKGDLGQALTAPVAADGAFAFNAVDPGRYAVSIQRCQSGICIVTALGTTVTVVDRDVTGLTIVSTIKR